MKLRFCPTCKHQRIPLLSTLRNAWQCSTCCTVLATGPAQAQPEGWQMDDEMIDKQQKQRIAIREFFETLDAELEVNDNFWLGFDDAERAQPPTLAAYLATFDDGGGSEAARS